jgi:protein-disulfide isomerase
MIKNLKTPILSLAAVLMMGSAPVMAAEFTDVQKAEIQALVKEYILENPGIVFEAAEKHQAAETAAASEKAVAKIAEYKTTFAKDEHVAFGNPKGDVTIVEFFDYNCGYCKRALPDLQKLVEQDKNVRVVLQEMPILGPTSLTASQWALAAKRQDKYFEFHSALMDYRGAKEESDLSKIAQGLGLDVEKMKADANSQEVADELKKSMEIARDIGVQGTPAFVIGDEFVPGYVPVEGLLQSVKTQREKTKS